MTLSIIMPCFKRPDLVRQGLSSIKKQQINVDYQVIVINDGIEDGTSEICDEFGKTMDIRYIFSGQRNRNELIYRCPSFAINIGVKQCTGDILLLTSPEIHYLTDDCLNIMIALSLKNPRSLVIPEIGYDDQKGIVTRRIMVGEKINPELEPLAELNVELPFCLMLHKKEFIAINGYDEDFIGYCYDDADLVRRLTQNGCGSYVRALDQKIIHLFHGTRTSRDGLKDRTKAFNYNRDLYNQREPLIQRNLGREWGVINMKEREEEFTKTFLQNRFQGRVSKSGKGSDLENVQILIPRLVAFLNENNIKTMIDAPCGDFNWMPYVLKQANLTEYRGYDIVQPLIEDNRKKYPGINFDKKDIVIDGNFGKADVLFCRDCLVHLSFASIMKVLKNFFYSDIKYLLTTTFTNQDRKNSDFPDGTNWFALNLEKAPFNLPTPRLIINEGCTQEHNQYTDKSLGLWTKTDLINHVEFR